MKKCSKCGETKELGEFHNLSSAKDGKQFACKECQKEARRKRTGVTNLSRDLHKDDKGRVCSSCLIYKQNSEFYLMSIKRRKPYRRSQCKSCTSEKTKARREVDGDRMREISHKSWLKHKDNPKYKERNRRYYQENKEAYKARYEKYKQDPEFMANKKVKAKEWEEANKERRLENKRKRRKIRRKIDPIFKMKNNIRCRLYHILKTKEYKKQQNTIDFLGCSWEVLWNHLNQTFEANYGMPREWLSSFEYEIDHIIPLSSAKSLEEVIKLNHYTNLQILTKEDNRQKSANLDWSI